MAALPLTPPAGFKAPARSMETPSSALCKTHYYGGIKKVPVDRHPLALHGVVIKRDGETVKVNIGEDEQDQFSALPTFCLTWPPNRANGPWRKGSRGEAEYPHRQPSL